ncbi:MAG: hypothetical protein H6Q89_3091 [Myxococcaceae bacterium]|nr:hypothetical protein [Myxococcaceae bacterium]
MKKVALACCLFAVTALAQGAAAPVAAAPAAPAPAAGGFKPRHVTKGGDKKGIEELYKTCEEAMKKGDVDAMAARVDFPVMMMTDNAAGVPSTSMWEKQQWIDSMKKSFADMPKDMKTAKKTKATFLSDSLAMVEETNEMTMGKVKDKWTSAAIVELKDGKWMFKGMIEGGWGDMMPPAKAEAPKAEPARTPVKAAEPAKPAK